MEELKTENLNICSGCVISYPESKDFSCERVFDFLLRHGVITNSIKCRSCNSSVELNISNKLFSCSGYIKKGVRCNFETTVWCGTFFDRLILPESTVFRLVSAVLWLPPPRRDVILQDLNINQSQFSDCFLTVREVLIVAVSENSKKLGGRTRVVELAEAKWSSNNLEEGLWGWSYGGIDHCSGETFLVPIEHHNKESFKGIIYEKISPGTIIVTDLTNCYTSEELEDIKTSLKIKFVHPAKSTISTVIKHHWSQVRKGVINLSCKRPPYSIDQLAEYLFKSKYPIYSERIHAYFVAAGLLYPPDR